MSEAIVYLRVITLEIWCQSLTCEFKFSETGFLPVIGLNADHRGENYYLMDELITRAVRWW